MGTMKGWKTRKANETAKRAGRDAAMQILGERTERARLRPLLERCEGVLAVSRGSTASYEEALQLLLADLRAELEADEHPTPPPV